MTPALLLLLAVLLSFAAGFAVGWFDREAAHRIESERRDYAARVRHALGDGGDR